ncbi:hypothetical protein GDO78_006661 [Eleutherodactylus coqui]|uniref:Uncharacterized protein n=1 Tax=Eleutherodactylus coqui TaxID=57060 RepID=A0A8J6FE77_ELECQ|nr:hypothetical protein GDO78_006661 [Eleutherodactylus coqui]
MADSGSNSLESGSQNSSGGSSGDAAQKKVKAPKVVKSRYMQYSKPKATKLKNNVANTTLSPGKGHERSRSGSLKSVGLQRLKAALNKTMQKSSPKSLSTPAQRKSKRETTSAVSIPEDTIEMLESQTLIFTYLTMKMQKNIRRLEDKAERSLLLAHEEKMQLQEKVQQLKRELLLNRREEQLNNLLEKQMMFRNIWVPPELFLKQLQAPIMTCWTQLKTWRMLYTRQMRNFHGVCTKPWTWLLK